MEKIFQLSAVIFAGIAAFFLWRGNADWLFFFAVLGAVCFFLGVRFQVGARVKQRREEAEAKTEEDFLLADKTGEFDSSDVEQAAQTEKDLTSN